MVWPISYINIRDRLKIMSTGRERVNSYLDDFRTKVFVVEKSPTVPKIHMGNYINTLRWCKINYYFNKINRKPNNIQYSRSKISKLICYQSYLEY
jgi:hypothetical protein